MTEATTTHIVYETPHRVIDALADVVVVFGPEQRIVLARELTKLHEEFLRGTASEVLAELRSRPSVRGEMVLLFAGGPTGETADNQTPAGQPTLAKEVAALMIGEKLSEMDALKRVAKTRGIGKSEAYREWQRSQTRRR